MYQIVRYNPKAGVLILRNREGEQIVLSLSEAHGMAKAINRALDTLSRYAELSGKAWDLSE